MYLSSHRLGKLATGSLIPEYAILAPMLNTQMLSTTMALAHGLHRITGAVTLQLSGRTRTLIHSKRYHVRLTRAILTTSWWIIHWAWKGWFLGASPYSSTGPLGPMHRIAGMKRTMSTHQVNPKHLGSGILPPFVNPTNVP